MKLTIIDYVGNLGGGARFVSEVLHALADRDEIQGIELRSSGMACQHYRSLLGALIARGRLDILNVPPAYGLQSRHCHPRWWHALPGMTLAPRLWFGRRWASDVWFIDPPPYQDDGVIWLPWAHTHQLSEPTKAPIVATFHDTIKLDFHEVGSPTDKLIESEVFRFWLSHASAVVVSSAYTSSCLARHFGDAAGTPAIIRMSGAHRVAGKLLPPSKPKARPFLLCPTNISPHKNIDVLLHAISSFPAQIDVVICGGGTDFLTAPRDARAGALRDLAESLGLAGTARLKCVGYISDAAYYDLLSQAWAVVMPTLAEGGGSFPTLEAMQLGIPVICSDIPVMREQVAFFGGEPIWFDPHDPKSLIDAVHYTAETYPDLARDAKMAMPSIRSRRWSDVASDYVALFNECLMGSRTAQGTAM